MKTMETTLKELANKSRLTEVDKVKINDITLTLTATEFKPSSKKCQNCYNDQIFILLNIIKKMKVEDKNKLNILKQKAADAEAMILEEKNKKVRMREPHGTNGLNFGNGLIINNNNVYLHVDFLKKNGLERFLIE